MVLDKKPLEVYQTRFQNHKKTQRLVRFLMIYSSVEIYKQALFVSEKHNAHIQYLIQEYLILSAMKRCREDSHDD